MSIYQFRVVNEGVGQVVARPHVNHVLISVSVSPLLTLLPRRTLILLLRSDTKGTNAQIQYNVMLK